MVPKLQEQKRVPWKMKPPGGMCPLLSYGPQSREAPCSPFLLLTDGQWHCSKEDREDVPRFSATADRSINANCKASATPPLSLETNEAKQGAGEWVGVKELGCPTVARRVFPFFRELCQKTQRYSF